MTTTPIDDVDAFAAHGKRLKAAVASWLKALVATILVALALRSFFYEPYNIPSESMQPGLYAGDYLFVAKWPYGFSRFSLPLALPLFDGRIGGRLPERGEVIVFKTPRDNRADFIKRVIGLPGDRIRMIGSQIELNGQMIAQVPVGRAVVPAAPGGCRAGQAGAYLGTDAGSGRCSFPMFVETLTGGRRVAIIDQIRDNPHDDTPTIIVPPGHVFVLGDNRDDSADSRYSVAQGGVGMVPVVNIVGRADLIFFSLDPAAHGLAALRTARIGKRL